MKTGENMQAWLEVDLAAIAFNYQTIKKHVGSEVEIIAVIKSDAYGHGLESVAVTLEEQKVSMIAVISFEEAIRARQVVKTPILIIGYCSQDEISKAIEHGFHLALYDPQMLPMIERLAERLGRPAFLHAVLDTGLNREGMKAETLLDLLDGRRYFRYLKIVSLMSHLSSAASRQASLKQLEVLRDFMRRADRAAGELPIHFVSSYGLKTLHEGYFDAVRVGLALYGDDSVLPNLKSAMTCKTVIMQVRDLPRDEPISYNGEYVTSEPTRTAVLAIGYADGLTPRTGQLSVLIGGKEVSIIGRICMNLMIANVTGLDVKTGDEAVILGQQADRSGKVSHLTISDIAKKTGLRHHEIVVRLGQKLQRRYKDAKH